MSDLLDLLPTDDGRLTCTDVHLPGCYNPTPAHLWPKAPGVTACICGAYWWPGQVGTWHSTRRNVWIGATVSGRNLYEPGPWSHYHLHANHCPERDTEAELGHVCGDVAAATAAEAWAIA